MPKTIRAAIILNWSSFVLGVSHTIFESINHDKSGGLEPTWLWLGLFLCISFFVNFLMIRSIKKQQNVARYVIAALYIYGIVQLILTVETVGAGIVVLQVCQLLGIIICLFLPASNLWFAKHEESVA